MPTYEITTPSGRRFQVTAPEGASQEEVMNFAQKYSPQSAKERIDNDAISKGARDFAGQGSDALGGLSQGALNLLAGAVRGAGSIGATIARPFESAEENEERRKGIDENMKSVGAQPESWPYRGGKLAGEVAGTAGVGNVMAGGVRAVAGVRAMSGLEPIAEGVAQGLSSGGFRVGELAGTGLGTATRIATGAATGAASASMANPHDAGIGAIIGGTLPVVVKGGVAAAHKVSSGARKMVGDVSPEVAQLAQRAEELGIHVPADRLADSRPLNAVASSLNYVPLSGRAATEDLMNSQLNRAVSRTFGQDSSNVTAALRKADEELGGQFEKVLTENGVTFDRTFLEDLATVHNKAEAELGAEAIKPIRAKINEIIQKGENGSIDGRAAYNVKRDLDRIGRGSAPNAWHALELKGILMDALNRSLGPEKAAAFAQVRKQYGNMLQLEKMAPNGAEGELSAARLGNMRNINNPELQELADIAAQFVKPREGAHGAAQRVIGAGGVLGTAGGAGAIVGGPVGAAISAGATMAGGRVANTVLNSNAARNVILKAPVEAGHEAVGAITQGVQRALPLAGAAAIGGAGAVALPEPAAHPASSPISQAEPAPSIANASTVDEAIAAATVAVHGGQGGAEKMLEALPAPVAPAPLPEPVPISMALPSEDGVASAEPQSVWFGRRGDGYAALGDAQMAMRTRQKAAPDLDWRLEQMTNGRYRLAGYQSDRQSSQGTQQDFAQLSRSGNLTLTGDPRKLRSQLAQLGITMVLPTSTGVIVGTTQASKAADLLSRFA